jgi:hypothetical protein
MPLEFDLREVDLRHQVDSAKHPGVHSVANAVLSGPSGAGSVETNSFSSSFIAVALTSVCKHAGA